MTRAEARIDLGALRANCERLRAELGEARLCAVVKADGYGHGAVACAEAAIAGGATTLAVATAAEAAELSGFGDLLTLGALTDVEVDVALGAGSAISLWAPGFLDLVAARARARGRPARIHVKHDSGMGRLGTFDGEEVVRLARAVAADPDLELAGVWTPFAPAHEPDHDAGY